MNSASLSSGLRLPPLFAESFDLATTETSLDRIEAGIAQFGDLFRIPAAELEQPAWVINHPELVKRVLVTNSTNYRKGIGMERVRILLGNGIIVSEGDFWRRQRRMMQPSFAPRSIARFKRMIIDLTERLGRRWEEQAASGTPINVTDDMSALTLDIVLRSLFGEDVASLMTESGKTHFALVNEISERNLKFAVKFRALTRLVAEVIARRRATPNDTHIDFLAMLMAARDADTGEAMSDKALLDEIMTIVVAGHETTASALNWAWYLLARHPEIEARMHAEVDAFAAAGDDIESLDRLPYVDAIGQEALRLYPPVWLFTRRTLGPDEVGGFPIEPNTDLFICPYTLHRHPEFWSNPELFCPERFLGDAAENRHRYAYLPFAMGPRRCVGEGFAFSEMRMHFALLARKFRLRLISDPVIALDSQVNLRMRHPLYMEVVSR